MTRDYAIYPATARGEADWLRDTALPWEQVHPRWTDPLFWQDVAGFVPGQYAHARGVAPVPTAAEPAAATIRRLRGETA